MDFAASPVIIGLSKVGTGNALYYTTTQYTQHKGIHTMLTLKTHDETLHGYKYCIADNHGNLIAVLPTKESQAREYEAIGIESDLMIEVMFLPYMAQS